MHLPKSVTRCAMRMLSAPLYWLYRLWCATMRYTETNRSSIEATTNQGHPVVFCLWHDELFSLSYLKRQLKVIALISQSSDGDLLDGVLKRMKLETARGSSSRGGVKALLFTAKRMREAQLCACITVDGPRGPRHEAKEGAIFLASRAEAPLAPVRLFMERKKIFNSWDKFQLPLPFSKVHIVCADVYNVTHDLRTKEGLQAECHILEEKLNALRPPTPDQGTEAPMPLSSRMLLTCARLLGKTGFSGIRTAGNGLGALLWHTLGTRRKLATANIARHITCSEATAKTLARSSFDHNARSFLESVLAPEFGLKHPLLHPERPDLIARLGTEERPAVIIAGHLGAWELLASLLGDISTTRPRLTVVRTYKNKALNDVSTQLRSSRGISVLGHREAALPVLRALKKNGYAAFLADHNTGRDEAVFLPFLGEEAAVNKGPALLAVRAKALVWPIFLLRDGKNYTLCMDDPLDTATLEGTAEDKTLETARFYTQAIERAIRRAPEQWFWMHNRWKTKKN